MTTYVDSVTMETIICYKCAVCFAMPSELNARRLKDRALFWCPNGHDQHYIGETEESKLKRELERKTQMAEAAEARAWKATAELGEVSRAHHKMRNRIMNGVCPCCNRTFSNLLSHMQTMHSDQPTLKALREAFGMTQAALAKEIGVPTPYVSLAERDRPLPVHGKSKIDSWVHSRTSKKAKSALAA